MCPCCKGVGGILPEPDLSDPELSLLSMHAMLANSGCDNAAVMQCMSLAHQRGRKGREALMVIIRNLQAKDVKKPSAYCVAAVTRWRQGRPPSPRRT